MKRSLEPSRSFATDGKKNPTSRSLVRRGSVSLVLVLLVLGAFPRRASANVIYVTTLKDEIGGSDGCSLKDAIYASKFQASVAIQGYNDFSYVPNVVATKCVPGNGNDTIVLPPGQILLLSLIDDDADNATGPAATPLITSNVTIEGYGATLQFVPRMFDYHLGSFTTTDTLYTFRAFSVASAGHLTLDNVFIQGFATQGGYGGIAGGGGGMGAGGAIYVQGGTLDVTNSTFQGNSAIGGNGGADSSGEGGGGGGLTGYGGPSSCLNAFSEPVSFAGGGGGARGDGTGSCSGDGGGTISDANPGIGPGFDCGGLSGYIDGSTNGYDATCPGGGGGGAIQTTLSTDTLPSSGNGGKGGYGGGGGGGACGGGNGGSGGFGGGGGAGCAGLFGSSGGEGGFGGGGGAGPNGNVTDGTAGRTVAFGGGASHTNGGGGAGLGGAIFNDGGNVTIENSTFTGNDSVGGRKGGNGTDPIAGTGEGHGGAIFSNDGSLTILNSTIDANLSSGSGGGVYFYQGPTNPTIAFILRNTIIANSGGSDDAASKQCTMNASIITGGDWRGNLIQNDDPSGPCDYTPSTGTVATGDPLLGPLQNNGGYTPTMAIGENSPAWNTADPSTSIFSDQRGWIRPELGGFDIGAYELCSPDPTVTCVRRQFCFNHESLTMQASPTAGGTTSPAPGTTLICEGSVIPILATPNPGYTFTGWSGNALLQNNPSAVVVMLEPQTITANFALCNCVVNVSGYVTVTRGPIGLNPVTRQYTEIVTVTNNSSFPIVGPVSLVLDTLSANATLSNAAGTTDLLEPPAGSPYLNSAGNLAPGQMTSFTLQFADPTNTAISYATRVLAGPGPR